MKLSTLLIFCFTCSVLTSQTPTYDEVFQLEPYNYILGTHAIGGKYQFTNESRLIEQSKHVRAMGSNILKISLGRSSPKVYGLSQIKTNSTLELFKSNPDYKMAFDMDFKYIFAWVHSLTDVRWKQGIDKDGEQKLYEEMFEFVSYLLTTYNNSGKTFMIGNWEGDWLLHKNYDRYMTPSKSHVKNMTKWFKIRQKAIDDAKKMTTHENVFVYHYIEVNLATKGMEGEVCVSESVLPKVNVDFVSYSSYEAIKNKNFEGKKQTLTDILNYLEGKLKPKKNLPFKRRVFIGEYGYHANKKNPQTFQKQFEETKEIMQIALELDLPFALHWTMYNNEYAKNGDSKQMSLISEEGEKMPLYFFHQNYYKRMNAFLKEYKIKNNSYPDSEAFKKEALNILRTL